MIFYEHFGENCSILLQTIAKLRCIKLCAIYSGPPCITCWFVGLAQYRVPKHWLKISLV